MQITHIGSRQRNAVLVVVALAALGTIVYGSVLSEVARLRFPSTLFTGHVSYDAGTRDIHVTGVPSKTLFFNGDPGIPIGVPSSLEINGRILDDFGNSVAGIGIDHLRLEGVLDVDRDGVIEAGESGVMLTGSLIQAEPGRLPSGDLIGLRFAATGGFLAPYFAGQNIGVSMQFAKNQWPMPAVRLADFANSVSAPVLSGFVKAIKCGVTAGDIVWHDLNANGVQDAGEPGVNGVTLRLKNQQGTTLATTVTGPGPLNQQGWYQFFEIDHFCAGTWRIEADASTFPAGFVLTTSNAPGTNAGNDSNPNPSTFTLASDVASDQTQDFGLRSGCDGRIGNFIWHDLNRNGVQDAGEPGLDGVGVRLLDAAGAEVAITTTTAGGAYTFTGLCPGVYSVVIEQATLPAGFEPVPNNVGGDIEVDSNLSPSVVTLAEGAMIDESIDFGFMAPCEGSIGDYVWYDSNQNGMQDAGELGIDGVKVYLVDQATDAILQTATTGANGRYEFTGVCGGSHKVQLDVTTLPPSRTPTAIGVGDASVDSNPNPTVITLPEGGSNDTIDFGFMAPCTGSIGDRVWFDENANGIQDAGEEGIVNVIVNLRRASDNTVIQSELTVKNGIYLFEAVCPGAYIIEVVPPSGTLTSPPFQGGNPETDSNPNLWPVTLVTDSSSDHSVDFGFYVERVTSGKVGDFVWNDLDQDGLQDPGEPGIPGVTVTLTDSNGDVRTMTTNAAGAYLFENVPLGTVSVSVTPPVGFAASPTLVGSGRSVDSNTNPTSTTLTVATPNDITLDFGFYVSAPPTPGIKIVKTANKHTVVFGEKVTFTYTVTNTGNVTLTNVVVRDDNATPRYQGDDFTVGTVPSLASGASVTFTATVVPPAKMCNKDGDGRTRKCGMIITKFLDSNFLKFIYLQAKDHRDDWQSGSGWWGGRSYSSRAKFRAGDFYGFVTQDLKGQPEEGDGEEYTNGFSVLVGKSLVTNNDGSVNTPRVYHKKGWDRDWKWDWDHDRGDWDRRGKWDDDKWDRDEDNDHDYDYDKHPKQCPTVSTNVAKVTASTGTGTVSATDKETVQVVAPTPKGPWKTYTQGGWGAKPSGNNPGKLLADNFARVYPQGITIGGSKTIKLTSSNAVEKFLPQGGTPAKLTQNYLNPNWHITVLAGQVLALKLNVDFSGAGVTRPGLGALVVVSGELAGDTVSQVLALAQSVLGGGSLPSGLTLSELNNIVTKINENFDDGDTNNGYLRE